jgi:hypothetical protein
MGAWNIESGRKAFFIVDAHDGEEITCVILDRPCRKIATGARNGIIKVIRSQLNFFRFHFYFFSRFGIARMVKIFMYYQVLKMQKLLEYCLPIKDLLQLDGQEKLLNILILFPK